MTTSSSNSRSNKRTTAPPVAVVVPEEDVNGVGAGDDAHKQGEEAGIEGGLRLWQVTDDPHVAHTHRQGGQHKHKLK